LAGGRSAQPKVDAELDRRFMAAALRLGRRNLGHTYPNPAVGAVIVSDGRVVGHGWTAEGGRPHAEVLALAKAGEAARGATVYVTLEPCSHHGRTPPCADALVEAGVARVVVPIEDPDPRVAGQGLARLEAAGIAVTRGVLADEAVLAHAGHISRVTRGRPWVTLKLAVSADGMIGRRAGERMIISGREAFEAVQAMRVESDAVMIGIGTVLVDNPRLTVRLPGLSRRSPVRVILDAKARLPLGSHLVAAARDVPLIAVVGPEAGEAEKDALREAGVRILEAEPGPGGVSLKKTLELLAVEGFTRVLAEGGSEVASSLMADELVDEAVIFRAEVVVGADGVRALGGYALSAIERSPRYRQVEATMAGKDQMRRYLRTA
jgi:diaminohydroxyphosphoribosylaminopyrimidine deaminase/5-amino-6-(5-phosphoribosylamino)uracil reductase